MTAISADTLATIGGTFDLQELQILSTLSFSRLRGVNNINWIALPALQDLSFTSGVTQANTVYISNTALTDMTGISLTAVGSMNLNNNQYLKTISINDLVNVTQGISIAANALNLKVAFPILQSTANLTIADSPNLDDISFPLLETVEGSLQLLNNSKLSTIGFDALVTVDGDMDLYGAFNS